MSEGSRYVKNFDAWYEHKKKIDEQNHEPVYFREGEVWFTYVGVNVGFEIDGTNKEFSRPVVILRKYNKYSFLALPLTTRSSANKYKIYIGEIGSKDSFAVVSQIRNLDSRRLYQKIGNLGQSRLEALREEVFALQCTNHQRISPRGREGEP